MRRKKVIAIPDETTLRSIKEIEERKAAEEEKPVKRGRGRPKGIKSSPDVNAFNTHLVDPKTGAVVSATSQNNRVIGRIGDEKVTIFVQYHIDMLQMRQGVDKKNVPDLYRRLIEYLQYCAERGIIPNNMNAYFAIGINKQDIYSWKNGQTGTPEHKKFANDVSQLFASIHEQGGAEGVVNPILSIFWAKTHDGLSDQPKIEVAINDPLGEKRSAEDIVQKYSDIELPD